MADRENVIKGLEKVWDAFNHMEHELYADYVFDALELLKEQQGISVDSFLKWCIESHIMGDATRNGIEYWINEFKAWKQKAKDGEQDGT